LKINSGLAKLKKLSLLRDNVEDWKNAYPFCVPVIRSLDTVSLTSRICFFAGENGSGSRFQRNGLFLLDEPEAALSPQRQLAFLVLLHDTLRKHKDAQSIISSHLPLLLGYPEAQILSFDGGKIPRLFPPEG
jgi:predicted ATPase